MATLSVQVRRVGNSLGVLFPKQVVEDMKIQERDVVKVEIQKEKVSGFGMARGAPPYDRKKIRDDIREW
ncbi:MAG: hypothetical protein HY558_04695 [Euryarchaeota archaeon]|nr:hypothetical protein [Euryarchaeota archaeon]